MKKYVKLFLASVLFVASFLVISSDTYGDDEGGGGNTGGIAASCQYNAYQLLCGNNGSLGGGASWRIFKTDDGWGLDDSNSYGGSILSGHYKSEAMSACSDEGWFASFGWDGMHNSAYGYSDFNFQIGPANRNGIISGAVYNNYGAKTYSQLMSDGFSNNVKIKSDAALTLYQQMHEDASDIPSGVGYFCVSSDHTLTAYAITDGGSFIKDSNKTDGNGKINVNTTISGTTYGGYQKASTSTTLYVAAPSKLMKDSTVYEFYNNWRWCFTQGRSDGNCNSAERGGGDGSMAWSGNPFDASYWSRIKDKSAYAIYIPNIVKGLSRIKSGDTVKTTTGWQHSDKTADTYFINNCSPTSGCSVAFQHFLKRTSGRGNSSYVITRSSNYWVSSKSLGVAPRNDSDPLASGTERFSDGNNQTVTKSNKTVTLYPGQVVCEKMVFGNNPGNSDSTATLKVCASALGNAQPDDPSNPDNPENPSSPSGDTSFINIKVRNQNVTAYNKFQREVYAKPTDKLTYRATYNPVLQYTYYLKPQKMRIGSGTIYPTSGKNSSSSLATMFNTYRGSSLKDWNNDITVYSSSFATSFSENYSYTNGSTEKRTETNDHEVLPSEAGRSLRETAVTNYNDDTKTTPSQVGFSKTSENYNLGTVSTTAKSKTAYAYVPYNYVNTTRVVTASETPLYAGETQNFKFELTTSPRQNNVTDGNYATKAPGSKHKIEFCYNGSCADLAEKSVGTLNPNGKMDGDVKTTSDNLVIPDVPAGTEICIRSAVYPANSGGAKNYSDQKGSDTWAYSPKVCYKAAKKPSLQVWGGNIYSNSDISTAISKKVALNGYDNGTYVFGSWGELGIIASSQVKGLASGAGTGYTKNNNGTLVATPGGASSDNFCNVSTLSLANANCNSGYVGKVNSTGTGNAAANVINKDIDSIKSRFGFKGEPNVSKDENVSLNNASMIKGNIHYYYGKERFNLAANTVNASTIQVVESDKDITITGDIKYQDSTYNFLSNENKDGAFIPKLIIMAENIKINCNVNRIDGVLIANGTVTTCADSNDINDQKNSRQLKINGAVIAGTLIPNRTYGASTGNNSIIPAEIINFDSSLYRFDAPGPAPEDPGDPGSSDESSRTRDYLDVTYIRELAPRY